MVKNKLILIVITLITFNFAFSQEKTIDMGLDTLFIKQFDSNQFPIKASKQSVENLFGKAEKVSKTFFVDEYNDKHIGFNYNWSSVSYINIDSVYMLSVLLFEDNKTILNHAKFCLNNKVSLNDIREMFPLSFYNRRTISSKMSLYVLPRDRKDLVVIPFVTEYGSIDLVFRNGYLYYLSLYYDNCSVLDW